MRCPSRGLYALTDSACPFPAGLAAAVEQAILGGAVLVQWRDKQPDSPARDRSGHELLQVCRAFRVPLIVNDDPLLARRIGADGVHLGRDDASLAQARRILGPAAIIGVSCYDEPERAYAAAAAGADYVAFGRFFPSRTKPSARAADLAMLTLARGRLSVPVVAIGGITAENGAALLAAGADLLAVSDGVFGQPAPRLAAARLHALFTMRTDP